MGRVSKEIGEFWRKIQEVKGKEMSKGQKEYERIYKKGSEWAYRELKKQGTVSIDGNLKNGVNLFKSVNDAAFKNKYIDDNKSLFYGGAADGCGRYLDEQREKRLQRYLDEQRGKRS